MKRFLAIFGLCLGAVAVFVGGYLGVKYLIGDFEPEVIVPEDIAFSQTEYYFDEGEEKYFLSVTTTTEGVTETTIKLSLIGGTELKDDQSGEMYWENGKIRIPKTAKLNTPFEIFLIKDNTYQNEIPGDVALKDWTRGGISNIIATSTNKLIAPATTTVYVDTPVYKTELVVLNNKAVAGNFFNTFKNVESSNFLNLATEENIPYVRAGETFYVGVKYYPEASAFKYGKSYATNLLVQYQKQIEAKIEELGLTGANLYEDVVNVCNTTEEITLKQVMESYKKLVKNLTDSERPNANILVQYVEGLISEYENTLKFNYLLENTTSSNKVIINGRVPGTNLYELTATQNLEITNFYTYSFKKSANELVALKDLEPNADVLAVLENEVQKGTVLKEASKLEIQDEEVDTLEMMGSINPSLAIDNVHTIYATKAGASNTFESFLNLKLSNSMLEFADLKDKVVNVGLKFQKNLVSEWEDITDELLFAEEDHYSDEYKITVVNGEKTETYYRPYGEAKYWQVYANNYVAGEFRAVVKYFIKNDDNPQTAEDESLTYTEINISDAESKNLMFSLVEASSKTENLVSWTDASEVELKTIEIENALKPDGSPLWVKQNQEFDLSTRVNFEQVNTNVYKTVRYFIYVEGNEDSVNLSEYFDTVNTQGINYVFNDGNTAYLYELTSPIIKLKDGANDPDFAVKAIYMTIRTDINGTPKMVGENKYDVIKYSAYKESLLERLSAIEFNFTPSLKNLSGTYSIIDPALAGVILRDANPDPLIEEFVDVLAVGSNKNGVLKVTIKNDEDGFINAIQNGEIKIVAKTDIATAQDFITSSLTLLEGNTAEFTLSTKQLEKSGNNIVVKLYIVYSVGTVDYYFALTNFVDGANSKVFENFEIIANTDSTAFFNVNVDNKKVVKILIERIYNKDKNAPDEKYTVYFEDGTSREGVNPSLLFDESNIIRVFKISFLGREETDGLWYLTSNLDTVCSISADGKTMTMNASGTATISLYIDGTDEEQDQIIIEYVNSGYVSYYWYLDGTSGKTKEKAFTEEEKFENGVESITIEGTNGKQIFLSDSATAIEENQSLFALWYYLEDGDGDNTNNNKKLSFNVTLSDANSISNYEAITNSSYNNKLPSDFIIKYNIGNFTTLNLVYTCVEIPTIIMKINLTITPVVTVTEFEVVDNSGEAVEAVEGYTYNVYSGHLYKFNTTFNIEEQTASYFVKLPTGEFKSIITNSLVKFDNVAEKYYFGEVKERTELRMFISNQSDAPTIGKLQQEIIFIIQPNVVLASNEVIGVELEANGTKVVNVYTSLQRQIPNSLPINEEEFGLTKTKNYDINKSEITFTFNSISTGYITDSKLLGIAITYGEKLVGNIQFNIIPKNYESNSVRFAKYNGQKAVVLVSNLDKVDSNTYNSITKYLPEIVTTGELFGELNLTRENMFIGTSSHRVVMGNFADYMAGNLVNISTEAGLLVNTGVYITIEDEVGNKANYLIVISQLEYPFVNIASNSPSYSHKNLDLHKLFVEQDTSLVKAYYQDNNLYVGNENYYGGDHINLLANAGDLDLAIFAINKSSNMEFTTLLIGLDEDVNNFVSIDLTNPNELQTNIVGQDIYVYLTLKYKIGRQPLNIPVVLLIKQSQKLLVNYPYDDSDFTEGEQTLPAGYGTEDYDSKYMLEETKVFNNTIMEYINFNQESVAQLVLTNERFIVQDYKLLGEEKEYVTNNNYNLGFKFEVAELYAKSGNTWTRVDEDKIYDYVSLNENILTITRRGLVGFRVKILVTTLSGIIDGINYSGGAQNYYYVQAGDVGTNVSLTLFKNIGGIENTTYFNETINLNTGDKISFNNTITADIKNYYYLKNYSDKLLFKVINGDNLVDIDKEENVLTIKLSPNESSFEIEVYTIYGILSKIVVNVYAYYNAEAKNINLYSGTELKLSDFINFTNKNNDVVSEANYKVLTTEEIEAASLKALTFNKYDVIDGKIRFAHSTKAYKITNFELWIETKEGGKDYHYLLTIPELIVNVGITTQFSTIQKDLGEYSLTVDGVTIEKDTWQGEGNPVFKFESENDYYNVSYKAVCNNQELTIDASGNIVIPASAIGQITKTETIYVDITLTAINIDGEELNIVVKCKAIIKPEYTVTINYSNGEKLEYIKHGEVSINFKEFKTLEDLSSISVVKSNDGTEADFAFGEVYNENKQPVDCIDDTSNTSIVLNDLTTGVYEATILINGMIYGSYKFEVRAESPYSIINNNIDEQTFISGYGAENPFGYGGDLILTLPTIKSSETKTIKNFTVIATNLNVESGEVEETEVLVENYYNGLNKIRYAIPLEQMHLIKINNLVVEYTYYDNADKEQTEKQERVNCTVCEIISRYQISYNGKIVDYAYYKNIFNIEGISIEENEELTTNSNLPCFVYTLSANIKSIMEEEISSSFFVECDIDLTLPDEDIHYTMNVNEYKETGLSLVNLFNIQDKLGNKFYINNVDNGEVFKLIQTSQQAVVSSDKIGSQYAIRLEPDILNGATFDYRLRALGATNNGTIVTFKLTYIVEEITYEREIKIKVLPDYIVSTLNNDVNATENSYVNRLELEFGKSITLADSTQKTNNNDQYYIYVYSKYDETTKNVSHTLNVVQDTNENYGKTSYSEGNLLFTYYKNATFGDKNITLTFTDEFGFSFNYYITLVSTTRIPEGAISLTKVNYYEDSTLNVFNVLDTTKTNGISITLEGDNASKNILVVASGVIISYEYTTNEPVEIEKTIGTSAITFHYQTQEFWNSVVGGKSVTLNLTIPIRLEGEDETFILEQSIVLNRKYELTVKEENTYVRDGVNFNAEHLVSVFDYSQNAYLGEPEITQKDGIRLNYSINKEYLVSASELFVEFEYETGKIDQAAKLSLDSINVYSLMKARAKTGNNKYTSLGTFTLVYDNDEDVITTSTFTDNIADLILKSIGIIYDSDNQKFMMDVKVKAHHISTPQTIDGENQVITFSFVSEDVVVTGNNIIYIDNVFGGQDLKIENYTFTIYQYLYKGCSENQMIKIFDTESNFVVNGALVNNVTFTDESTGTEVTSTKATKIKVSELKVTSNAETFVLIKYKNFNGEFALEKLNINIGTTATQLEDIKFNGAELFTGVYKLEGGIYTIASQSDVAQDESNESYSCGYSYNGLTVEAAALAKNINTVEFVNSSGEKISAISLTESGTFAYAEKEKVLYQAVLSNLIVKFATHSASKYEFTDEETIRVTLKYTGINTDEVYVGTSDMAYIQVNKDDTLIKENITVDGLECIIAEGKTLTYSLSSWSEGFKLEPGVGVNALLAKYFEANSLNFDSNKDMLTFKLKQVQSIGDEEVESDLISIENGNITLKPGFNLSSYYITIEIYCKYPYGNVKSEKSIGEIYIAFNVVENKYKLAESKSLSAVEIALDADRKTKQDVTISLQSCFGSEKVKIDEVEYDYSALTQSSDLKVNLSELLEGATYDNYIVSIPAGTVIAEGVSSVTFNIFNLKTKEGYMLKTPISIGTIDISLNITQDEPAPQE